MRIALPCWRRINPKRGHHPATPSLTTQITNTKDRATLGLALMGVKGVSLWWLEMPYWCVVLGGGVIFFSFVTPQT